MDANAGANNCSPTSSARGEATVEIEDDGESKGRRKSPRELNDQKTPRSKLAPLYSTANI